MIMRNGNWKNDDLTEEEEAKLQLEEAKQEAEQKDNEHAKKRINFKQLFNAEKMREQLLSNDNE